MTDYKKISHQLTAALSDIIDLAQSALEKAEEEILAEPHERTKQIQFPDALILNKDKTSEKY